MNLPLVVDIAIGLVFIYLTLSLLTSEIQELIATLLQWRAEHLKKSIENLLTGNDQDDPTQQNFVDELYSSPLIKSLNQEARGLFARAFRQITHGIGATYRTLTGERNVFGYQKSGPSYIPPATFSMALLQKLHLHELSQTISELTLKKFRDESLWALRDILEDLRISLGDDPFTVGNGSLLEKEFYKLEQTLKDSLEDFISGRASLAQSLKLMAEQLVLYIDNTDSLLSDEHHCKEIIRRRLAYLKQSIARQRLEPTITEVLRLLFDESERQPTNSSYWATQIVDRLNQEHPELLQQVTDLPPQLRNNLLSLASRARTRAKTLEEEVRQLEQEVAQWFNHSMERASGVYRRNAKGIAILIGFLVAVMINADTLHMIDRLSKDTLVRSSITQAADRVIVQQNQQNSDPANADALQTDLQQVKTAVDQTLDELPLPIGWHSVNVAEQNAASKGWAFPLFRRILGWTITGVALSMGATFWFDLLNKVMRVRSTGNKPKDQD